MKLGDNMAAVEACVWGDVCPRKSRPPRIGDIPKHGAVDEESPGISAKKLTSSPSEEPEAVPEVPVAGHGDAVFGSRTTTKTPTTTTTCTYKNNQSQVKSGISESLPVVDKNKSQERRKVVASSKIDTGTRFNSRAKTELDGSLTRKFEETNNAEDTEEIREVRKDSALYLEESESLQDLREGLKGTRIKSLAPRRESSGYGSNRGTFDEDRRNSEVDLTGSRERRRSSAKRITSETYQIRRISRGEELENTERMPTSEVHRKVSSSGLEMPDIQEAKDAELQETLSQESFICGTRGSFGSSRILHGLGQDTERDCSTPARHRNAPMTFFKDDSPEESATERKMNSEEVPFVAALSYAEVLSRAGSDKDQSRNLSRAESFDASSSSLSGQSYRQRKRIVHQYSTPNFSTTELESILERSAEKSPEGQKEVGTQGEEKMLELSKNGFSEGDERRNEEQAQENQHADTGVKLLPKPVKVYQLLSTQSEDRGDGVVPHLADRRISLQISRQEDAPLPVTASKPVDKKLLHADSVPVLDVPEMLEPGQHLTPTMIGCSPVRKLSSPGEVNVSHRLLADGGLMGVRPIYPYCPYSPYGSPQGSPRTRRRPLRESRRVSIDNRQGALQLNQYKLLDNIGQGSYGIVKLAYNEEDETHYAMKILSKKKLMKKAGIFGRMAPRQSKGASSNPLAKVYREIALLKKLDHPNVVKLLEVLDDPDEDNLYLVFELVQRGEVLQLPTDKPLEEETARIHFRDIVMGVEYLHYQRIVHRDIKPSNLLVDSEGRVKVADLGVSAELRAAGELLSGPAGTPAFAAPETTTPGAEYSGTLCDVWSMGVTLYSLVTGRVPWNGDGSIIGVQAAVRSESLKFPEKPKLNEDLHDLISRMLAKDPSERITLPEIKEHPWVTCNGREPLPSEADNCRLPVTVTDEEVARVVTRVPKLDTLILIKTMLKQHSFQNPFLPRRTTKSTCSDATSEISSTRTSESSETPETADSRTIRFYKSGRSNSAPDSYEWQGNDRQVSVESPLPPVTEVEVERR
ncbi:uncharacterized protein LOC107266646 isoform X2 [Cephus cinctus]|uniref:calcium/calmodulin-dependent protein kinase n=1 Tax=Cephus cinctus TaxID=211228 RepID=A0AAJ7FI14_CEPCN|nr:uncharacterized protein LOC107266646 isoform X2 [Cephus cinctus]XP_015592822.1 uncharacterized protein LOC107266646 isoform X2 [Cephus cinctus]